MRTDKEFIDRQRQMGDAEADDFISNVFESQRAKELYALLERSTAELFATVENDPIIGFLRSKRPEPSWFDEKQILRGQQIFETYAVEIMTLLGVMALPYCFAGVPGNKALYLSDKMRKVPAKRLTDTADFIISVSSVGSLTRTNEGHVQIQRTRLIHALARYHLQKVSWNYDWGAPINQEDLAGTNLAFSCIILFGLQRSGILLSEKQKHDFISLWRYIGYHLAITDDLLPTNFKEAAQLVYVIKERNFKWSEEGVELTKELISYYRSVLPKNQRDIIASQVRYFVGEDVANHLGINTHSMQDLLTGVLNTVTQTRNILSVHQPSFHSMILQHTKMKASLQARTAH